MATSQTPSQKKIVSRVMGAFKHGDLVRNDGEPVSDPKQAVAIALREAGASDRETPAANRRNLRRTKAREREDRSRPAAPPTRAELYAEAKRRGIKGRSTMSKVELERALRG